MLSRICPPVSFEAQEHLASPLPASLQEELPPSYFELCNSGVYIEGCRSTNKDVWRQSVEERGWARVCSGSSPSNIKGIYKRQFRVTCSSADSPHRRMKPEVKSCWRKAKLSAVATVKFWCTQTQDSRGIAGDSSLHVLLILPQWQSNTSFSVTSHIFSLNPLKTPSTAVH